MSKDHEIHEGFDRQAAGHASSAVNLSTEHVITRTTEHNAQYDGKSLAFGNANGMHGGIYGALPELADRQERGAQNYESQYGAGYTNRYSDREERGYDHHGHGHHGYDRGGYDYPSDREHRGHGGNNGDATNTALTDLVETVAQDATNAGEIFGKWGQDIANDIPGAHDPKAVALADLLKEVTTNASNATQVLSDWMDQLFNDLGHGHGHGQGHGHGGCGGGDVPPVAPPLPPAPPEVPPTTPPYNGGGDVPPVTPPYTPPVVPPTWGGGDTPPVTPPEVPPAPPEVPPTTPPGGTDNPNDPAGIASRITNDGVSQSDVNLAVQLFNAMPQKMQDAFLQSGAKIVLQPYQGGAQGYNDGQTMVVNTGTGMFAQAFLHEAYEVVGQNTGLNGTWGDAKAVGIADKEEQAGQVDPGDLNDNVGSMQGDGDWMSNVFVAGMYKRHPELFSGDSPYMLPVATQTAQESPQLAAYMDQTLFA